uniref:Uncharacterized protein n=1 Tax=Anguilla anguilla TaxID=7936 RepID=A0A0E9TJB7_ANGAN
MMTTNSIHTVALAISLSKLQLKGHVVL